MSLTILGPERPDGILPAVLARHGHTGPLALVSAGWRYDEARDELLRAALPNEVRNLRLYDRFRMLERDEPELIARYTAKQDALRKVKLRYRLWLRTSLGIAATLLEDNPDRECPWFKNAIRNLHEADELFLAEASLLHEAFETEARPGDNRRVRKEREAVREEIDGCAALCIAGGHIGVLRNRCFFFDLGPTLKQRPLYAWSAGAMLLTERILLFHDHTGYGPGTAEFLDHGFGLLRNTIFLPHAQERLRLNDTVNLSVLASRLAPRTVMGLENGALFEDGHFRGTDGSAFTLRPDGSVNAQTA